MFVTFTQGTRGTDQPRKAIAINAQHVTMAWPNYDGGTLLALMGHTMNLAVLEPFNEALAMLKGATELAEAR